MIPLAAPRIGDEERAAVDRVLQSGQLAAGPEVDGFEDEFSSWVAGRRCIGVNSGTSALHLAMSAAGVGPGDEVIVPAFTFAASGNAVRLVGAEPVFVDIDPRDYCIDVAAAEAQITSRTVAVMAVHLYGQPARMRELQKLAERHSLLLIEDAAQAHAAHLDGIPVGAWGDVAAFSFYPTKNMTTGEGGMIVTADPDLERRARLLRNQGMDRPYENELVGHNVRMTDIAAAIGRVQLRSLDRWTELRRRNAATFDEAIRAALGPGVAPEARHDVTHVYHQYTIRIQERERAREALRQHGIATGVYYPIPLHRLPAFERDICLPEAERAADEVLSIPVHPHLSEGDRDEVVWALVEALLTIEKVAS